MLRAEKKNSMVQAVRILQCGKTERSQINFDDLLFQFIAHDKQFFLVSINLCTFMFREQF